MNTSPCPFEWPSTAVRWVEGLISSAAALTKAAAKSPQTEVDILMAGLCSHNREVDPFHELQDLLFNLKTIKDLEKYV